MKRYDGFMPQKASHRELLPPGGYVAKIMKAEDLSYSWGEVLLLSFDVAEGEYAGHFASDYRQNTREDRKWRGTHRLTQPRGDGSERDGWAINAMNNAVAVIQESNPGYAWDWGPIERGDYSQLKGKLVGILYRRREWEWNGKTGWTTECCGLIPAQDVRDGSFAIPADKPLNSKPGGSSSTAGGSWSAADIAAFDSDDDLPF